MDISRWPMDRIMRLPDWCFGRQWPVAVEEAVGGANSDWRESALSLPASGVIWGLHIVAVSDVDRDHSFRLALGLTRPTTVAEMNGLDPLFQGLGVVGIEPRQIMVLRTNEDWSFRCRQQCNFEGRKLILEVTSLATNYIYVRAIIIVSSMPKEVPDWLASAQAINL